MILMPDLMQFKFNVLRAVESLVEWTAQQNFGAVILVPSDNAAIQWKNVAAIAQGSNAVEELVKNLQDRVTSGPAVFANRYDGIDLPGDSCRLLVMNGLPAASSSYESFRASALHGGVTITRVFAQRLEQGIGRGARGAGDYCVVLLVGADIAGWIAKDANFKFLTNATRAQLEMGAEISKQINSWDELAQTINRSFIRDSGWVEYHAETLAELVNEETPDNLQFIQATTERKAINLWQDGYHEQAIAKIEKAIANGNAMDNQIRGWMEQLAARIADRWGNTGLAEDFQRQAYAHNRNLIRPKILPPYRPCSAPGPQANAIISQLGTYRLRRGFLQTFEDVVAYLHPISSANQFEKALAELAVMVGFYSERHDENGEGPDVLWLLPGKVGLVIEAKSRKKTTNSLTKEEHGQLLIAAEWFARNYKGYDCVRVCMHPTNRATKAAGAQGSHALIYEKLTAIVSDARALLTALCESQLSEENLVAECERLLEGSPLRSDRFADNYLLPFEENE